MKASGGGAADIFTLDWVLERVLLIYKEGKSNMKQNNKSSGVDLYSIDVGIIGVYIFTEPPFKDDNIKETVSMGSVGAYG